MDVRYEKLLKCVDCVKKKIDFQPRWVLFLAPDWVIMPSRYR